MRNKDIEEILKRWKAIYCKIAFSNTRVKIPMVQEWSLFLRFSFVLALSSWEKCETLMVVVDLIIFQIYYDLIMHSKNFTFYLVYCRWYPIKLSWCYHLFNCNNFTIPEGNSELYFEDLIFFMGIHFNTKNWSNFFILNKPKSLRIKITRLFEVFLVLCTPACGFS